jgi:hypothetical protein
LIITNLIQLFVVLWISKITRVSAEAPAPRPLRNSARYDAIAQSPNPGSLPILPAKSPRNEPKLQKSTDKAAEPDCVIFG